MVGRDVNSAPTQYRTWIVNNTPDFDGYFYAGLKSGPHPLVDVNAYNIPDGYVMDFNLPIPTDWETTYCTLPGVVSNGQLAIIDGYIYLFGGERSSKIYRAPTSNPGEWVDTGDQLPLPLSGSQFVDPNDGYIYLIGGCSVHATDLILRASRSAPTVWTNMGSRLPCEIHKSQLYMGDGYIYLFGGHDMDGAVDFIFRASISDPLTWEDTGSFIPNCLFGSVLAVMNDRLFLIGGLFQSDVPTNKIYSAPVSNPTSWSAVDYLPNPVAYGQFVRIGNEGYLYTSGSAATSNPDYQTRIFKCDVNLPTYWYDTYKTIPAVQSQSHLAIVYDRIFLFGGSASTIITACDQNIKFNATYSPAIAYGALARTQFQATPVLDRFKLLGFPPWKCNYS